MNDEVMRTIVKISGRLGRGWEFEMREFFDGVQCNWRKGGMSVMWRSVRWNVELVEMYKEGSVDELVGIDEL